MAIDQNNGVEKLSALRGMVDVLPDKIRLWQLIEETFRFNFTKAAIEEIRTPLLESTALFARGIGDSTDVVGKEMYTFFDRGERSCTLRPEGTASVVRAAIQHGLVSQGPQRLWYSGPMFRYERPQAGRQRQFHQIGTEFLGYLDPRSDVESISLAWDLLKDLGLKGLKLEINSLGDSKDRMNFRKELVDWLKEKNESLDQDSRERLNTNPLRILDSKNQNTQNLLKDAPKLSQSLSQESKERFEKIKAGLKKLDIPFVINNQLVRGLDYYNHTAFEITSSELGAQATVCGGGRYDGLIQQLGGPPTPAIGWAIGLERLFLLMSQENQGMISRNIPDFYVVNRGNSAESFALKITRNLRLLDQRVEIDLSSSPFSKQLKRADKRGSKWAIIIGDNEAEAEEIILKHLRSNDKDNTNDEQMSVKAFFERFT